MKFKDLMMDLATGDASAHDPYIAEAAGKVKVSAAIFEAAVKINELANNGELQVVQEAADAGLPTDAEGAAECADTAVVKGLEGLFDMIVSTAKKVKEQTTKDMKVLRTIGKKYGVEVGEDFEKSFSVPLAKAIFEQGTKTGMFKNKIELPDLRFLKAKYSDDAACSFVRGMAALCHAYGFDISEIFNDATIARTCGKYSKNTEITSFTSVAAALTDGGKLMACDSINKDKHYTSTVKENDIVSLSTNLYIIIAASTAIVDAIGKAAAKKTAMNTIKGLCNESASTDKKISKSVTKIGSNITTWSDNVGKITEVISKAFGDSVYSLSEALSGKSVAKPEEE